MSRNSELRYTSAILPGSGYYVVCVRWRACQGDYFGISRNTVMRTSPIKIRMKMLTVLSVFSNYIQMRMFTVLR